MFVHACQTLLDHHQTADPNVPLTLSVQVTKHVIDSDVRILVAVHVAFKLFVKLKTIIHCAHAHQIIQSVIHLVDANRDRQHLQLNYHETQSIHAIQIHADCIQNAVQLDPLEHPRAVVYQTTLDSRQTVVQSVLLTLIVPVT